MSKQRTSDRFSLSEFSEYLDDTDGHRLAQFLQKKSGAVRNGGKPIFDCEPTRFSLNVRVRPLSSPPAPAKVGEVEKECVIAETQDVENEKSEEAVLAEREVLQQHLSQETHSQSIVPNENIKNTKQNETAIKAPLPVMAETTRSNNKTSRENQSMMLSPVKSHVMKDSLVPEIGKPSKISENVQVSNVAAQNQTKKQADEISLAKCLELVSPPQLEVINLNGNEATNPSSPSSRRPELPRPIFPRTPHSSMSKVNRSGGRSGDRLRRQVLKRLSNIDNNGRRTLLKEFESTLGSSGFSPPICSTPRHHTPAEHLLKTPPRINNSQNIPKTPERNTNISNHEASQHTQTDAVKQQEQPLRENIFEALEETFKKIKSFENLPPSRATTPDSSIYAKELPQTQVQLQNSIQTTTGNTVNQINVPGTEDLLLEVQKMVANIKNSYLQSPKIVIPVNQTFNNVPPAADKQVSVKETNCECESSKVAQQRKSDQTISCGISRNNMHGTTTYSHCTKLHTVTESNSNNAINCKSPNNFKNHPTFTCNNITKSSLPTDSIQHNNVTSRGSLNTLRQQTFTKQNGTYINKVNGSFGYESHTHETSTNKCSNKTFANSTTAPSREIRAIGNEKASAHIITPNKSPDHSRFRNADNKRPAAPATINSKHLESDLAKSRKIVHHSNIVAPTSTYSRANNTREVPTDTTNKGDSAKHTLTKKSISMLLTDDDDDDEEDTHYTANRRQILRKSGPLNLATEKPQATKRNRRTIKRPTRTRAINTKAVAEALLTSDTETDSGPPPAHPLNLQHVKPVEHKKLQQLKRRPLNKAPSTPKNGELFADELKAHLARLTNHEILDLRKRNSMGLINGRSFRKSTVDMKQVLQNKLQIEEEIELEILRRELSGNTEGLQRMKNTEVEPNLCELSGSELMLLNDVVNEIEFDELPQAPAAYKDSTTGATKTFEKHIDVSVPPEFKDNTAVVACNTAVALVPSKDNAEIAAAAFDANTDAVISATAFGDSVVAAVTTAAPEAFRDNADVVVAPNALNNNESVAVAHQTLLQLTKRSYYNSSLVDDRSSERVTFVSTKSNNNTNERKSRRRNKKSEPLPEVTKKYFELQNSIQINRKQNFSKRSLYSKGDSFHGDSDHSDNEKDNCRDITTLMEPIPPPPIVSPVSDIQIPSPPPPLADSTASTCMLPQLEAEPLVLPPTPFSDNSANAAKRKTKSISHTNAIDTRVTTPTDDELFKKPTKLAPQASRKRKERRPSTFTACNVNEMECTADTEGIRRSKRGQVPRNLSFLTTKRNGHSLFESLLNNIVKPRPSTSSTRTKQQYRISSNYSNDFNGRGDDSSTPVASSTVNGASVRKRGRPTKSKGKAAQAQAQAFSYLGDTNVTACTVSSRGNAAGDTLSTRLGVIVETPAETEEEYAAMTSPNAATPAFNDDELPSTSTAAFNHNKNNKTTMTASNATTTKINKKTKTAMAEHKARTRKRTKRAEKEAAEQASDDDSPNRTGQLECSRVNLPPPPSLAKLSEMFDELKNAANISHNAATTSGSGGAESSASTAGNARIRPVRVRLRRLTAHDTANATATSSASTTATNDESTQTAAGGRNELLTWLKNVSHLHAASDKRQVFMDMRPSTAGKLFFTDLEGLDYAFYDTEDKCSLGYLRFKPLQCKPSKRAKKYHLHFVVLAGTFEISTERESGSFGVGDMVAINIGCRYSITNMENDIGILMVIKK